MPDPEAQTISFEVFDVGRLRRAIQIGNAAETRRLIEAAGERRIAASVPYLAALLRQKDRWNDRLARNRPPRRSAKLAAVDALQKIGNLAATEALAVGLFDRDERINRRAAQALISFGGDAVPPLLRVLESRSEWTMPQMRLLIETLGEIGDLRSGPGLARVLLGLQPLSSTRWFHRTFLLPCQLIMSTVAVVGFTATIASYLSEGSPATLEMLLTALAGWLFGGLFIGLLLFLPFFFVFLLPAGIAWSNTELAALAKSAADVLIRMEDKRSLPSVIEAAYAGRRKSQPAARRALRHLLLLLNEEDANLLPRATLQMLLDSISPMRQALAPQSPDLIVAIVLALRYIGPGSAVETAQKLEQRSDAPPVRDACREVLPILRARRELERASSTLLRASALPATPEALLLRPASAAPETCPNALLRPVE